MNKIIVGTLKFFLFVIAIAIFGFQSIQTLKNIKHSLISLPQGTNISIPLTAASSLYSFTHQLGYKESVINREGPSALLENGGLIDFRNRIPLFLCSLNLADYCQSKYIADSIDLLLSFNPVYSVYQEKQNKRYETHFNFIAYLKTIGIPYQVVEAILPHRGQTYMATSPNKEPWEMQLEIRNPFYYRENLVNVAAKKTQDLWEYLLMIDGHQYFDNLYWWEETIWKLEHFTGVQLFRKGVHIDLMNKTVAYYTQPSVAYLYAVRADLRGQVRYSGNAWGIKKDVYNKIDYIIDFCIVGGCDGSYFLATIKPDEIERELTEPVIQKFRTYFKEFDKWIWHASEGFQGQDKYIRGNMIHFYHEEFFSYLGLMVKMNAENLFSYERDFGRDENFTLYLKNETLATMIDEYFYGKELPVKLNSIIVTASHVVFSIYMHIIRFIAVAILGYKV